MERAVVLSLVGMFIAGFAVSEVAMAGVNLDGMTFAGKIGKKGESKADKDTFIFKAGTFRSTACDPYGFKPAAYTAASPAGATRSFQAVCASPTDGKMTWNGKVEGDQIEGTSLWEKPGQAPVEQWFKGTLKK